LKPLIRNNGWISIVMNNTSLERPATLCDVLDRILNQGVVVHGEITVSVAGVDLLYVSLRGLVSAVDAIVRQNGSLEAPHPCKDSLK
jgi:hypothetical protein